MSRQHRLSTGTITVLSSLLLLVSVAGAQEPGETTPLPSSIEGSVILAGVVVDRSGRALHAAEIRAGRDHVTLSDESGRFVLELLPPGQIQVLVRRIGYLPADVILEADPGLRVDVVVTLVPSTVQLGEIVVEGRRMDNSLWRSGFYERERRGSGTFFGPEYLRNNHAPIGALLQTAPRVQVARSHSGAAIAYGIMPNNRQCALNVFLDGVHIRWANDVGVDQLVSNRDDLLAVEIYPRLTQVPPELAAKVSMTRETECGAVALWTKR